MMMSLGEDSTEKSLADDTLKSTSPGLNFFLNPKRERNEKYNSVHKNLF